MTLDTHPLLRRLQSIFPLTPEDAEAITSLPMTHRRLSADQDIVRQGSKPTQTCVVLDGVASMYKITGPGRRQIMNFYIPGDIPDLHSLHLETMDSNIGTLTPCTIALIPHDVLRSLCNERPNVSAVLWKMTLIDSAVFREWIVNVGQRDAVVRLAHLLCEMYLRFAAVGLSTEGSCRFPLTQQELADATGISVVHVNRMLQELRSLGLITLAHRTLTVLDLERLQRFGDFDTTYLHIQNAA